MAALKNQMNKSTVNRNGQVEHPRNNLPRDTTFSRVNEDYIAQVSEEMEGTLTLKLFQEFIRTDNLFLDALSKQDEFFLE